MVLALYARIIRPQKHSYDPPKWISPAAFHATLRNAKTHYEACRLFGGTMEKIATSIITVGSLLLFLFWFRYVCLLVLNARPARDYAIAAAAANQLSFPDVQAILQNRAAADLEELRHLLDRDFALL